MKLFLASEGKNPKSLEKLTEFVDGFEGKRIVYIPTAMNGTFYGAWKDSNTLRVLKSLNLNLDIIELENNHYIDAISQIGKPDILWFAGGYPGYLLYWIRRVELDKALPEILDSGTVYVGSSASSMVCSKTQNVSSWFIGESEPGADLLPGLGLINFEIYPHYQDELSAQIDNKWEKGKLCLLKDGEAVIVDEDKIEIFGEERFLIK